MRRVLDAYDVDVELTRSELERRFLALCQAAGVPAPSVNLLIDLPGGQLEADFAWPSRRLIVEVDGHKMHGTRLAFERDRRRDQRLACAGWRVVRFTWRQLVGDRAALVETVRSLLPASRALA